MDLLCMLWRRRLSAYYDGILRKPAARQVALHLSRCLRCADWLEDVAALSGELRSLADAEDPPMLWGRIEDALAPGRAQKAAGQRAARPLWIFRPWPVLAVLGLLAVLTSMLPRVPRGHLERSDLPLALDLQDYVEALGRDPQAAPQALLARYDGREVDLRTAMRDLGFHVLTPPAPPRGFHLQRVCLLKTGCCRALQLRYAREGDAVDLFQQTPGHPFKLPPGRIQAYDLPGLKLRVAEQGQFRVATWSLRGTNMAVVGRLRNTELLGLVEYLASSLGLKPAEEAAPKATRGPS